MANTTLTLDVQHCARCGKDHPALEFSSLSLPSVIGGKTFAYWTLCPKSDEPLYASVDGPTFPEAV
jgi:hypothetical protein